MFLRQRLSWKKIFHKVEERLKQETHIVSSVIEPIYQADSIEFDVKCFNFYGRSEKLFKLPLERFFHGPTSVKGIRKSNL